MRELLRTLSAGLAKSPGFKWTPGMRDYQWSARCIYVDALGWPMFVCEPDAEDDDEVCPIADGDQWHPEVGVATGPNRSEAGGAGGTPEDHWSIPDLEDPATLGCLMRMVWDLEPECPRLSAGDVAVYLLEAMRVPGAQ
jgi:hypothetical protein